MTAATSWRQMLKIIIFGSHFTNRTINPPFAHSRPALIFERPPEKGPYCQGAVCTAWFMLSQRPFRLKYITFKLVVSNKVEKKTKKKRNVFLCWILLKQCHGTYACFLYLFHVSDNRVVCKPRCKHCYSRNSRNCFHFICSFLLLSMIRLTH